MEQTEIKAKIGELKKKYAKLAANCRAAGLRVSSETVQGYLKQLKALEKQLN